MIKINLQKASVSETVLAKYQSAIDQHTVSLENKTGKGNDFLGWLHLPTQMTEAEITKIEQTASKIKQIAEIFVVIGIGGSYLGAKAVIDALSHHFASVQTHAQRKAPLVVFAGQNLCADYHTDRAEWMNRIECSHIDRNLMNKLVHTIITKTSSVSFVLLNLPWSYVLIPIIRRIICHNENKRRLLLLVSLSSEVGYNCFVIV
ncbi:MAG: hypothetical protein EAZ97_03015 [Bacteroidetes bacterium]|nr:MAG: hypothetical protein EAZ97_03015 [Bacteroidota bacterium]